MIWFWTGMGALAAVALCVWEEIGFRKWKRMALIELAELKKRNETEDQEGK